MSRIILLIALIFNCNNALAEVTLTPNSNTTSEKILKLISQDEFASPQTIKGISSYGDLEYGENKRMGLAIVYAIDTNGQQNIITSFEQPAGKKLSVRPAPTKGWGWSPLRYIENCIVDDSGWECPIEYHITDFIQIDNLNNVSYVDNTLALIKSQLPIEEHGNLEEYTNALLNALEIAEGGEVVLNKLGNFRSLKGVWSFEDKDYLHIPSKILVCHHGRNTEVTETRFIKHIEHGDTVGECEFNNRPTRAIGVNCVRDWDDMIETCELSNEMPGLELIKAYGMIYTIEIKHWPTPYEHCYKSGCYITHFGLSLNGGEYLYMRYDHEDGEIWLNSGNGVGGAKFWSINSSLPLENGTFRYNEKPVLFSSDVTLEESIPDDELSTPTSIITNDETATPTTMYDEFGEPTS